jgi:hypothetical protein
MPNLFEPHYCELTGNQPVGYPIKGSVDTDPLTAFTLGSALADINAQLVAGPW